MIEKTLRIEASRPYDVVVAEGLVSNPAELGRRLAELVPERAALVTDSNVDHLYGAAVEAALGDKLAGTHVIEPGEASKTPVELVRTLESFAVMGLTRRSTIIALGGGVVGDLAGLAAALWMRGVECVQIPTSLLAMVDSSVGGKTAVDLPSGKNLMGAFAQPKAVLIDPQVLETLPQRELSCGWGEIIKYAGIDKHILSRTTEELGRAPEGIVTIPSDELIYEAVNVKRRIVVSDEREKGERRLLNLGHTVGHAVESAAKWKLSHGAAVGIGMAVLTRALVRDGKLPEEMLESLVKLLSKAGLPAAIPEALLANSELDFSPDALLEIARHDKKSGADGVAAVLPVAPGLAQVETVSWQRLRDLIALGLGWR